MIIIATGAARADWLMSLEKSGFMGQYALGVGYQFYDKHAVELLVGVYDAGDEKYYQTNILYRYSRWQINRDQRTWFPVQIGFFTVRSWDQDNYFIKSPSQYPTENYYESTAFRAGFEFGTTLYFNTSRWSISYRFRIVDNGLVAIFNNENKDLQYYTSSGLALQYLF